jgi:hypothetical protein
MDPIPWYKSNVLRALMVGFVAFVLKKAGLADQFPDSEGIVNTLLDAVQCAAGLWAAYSRVRQPTPPVTMSKTPPPSVQPVLASVLLAVLFCGSLVGCESLGLSTAQTNEQKAAALLGDFTLYQKASLQIGSDPTVVPEVRKAVLDAAIAAKPGADQLDATLRQYRQIKAQLAAGATTDDKLSIVAANLTSWIRQLTPQVTQLRKLVEGVGK